MRVTLVRHAIAVSRDSFSLPGDDRPLTQKGIRKMKDAAAGITRILPRPDAILSSPLLRASETARIVSAAYEDMVPVGNEETLLPERSPDEIVRLLSGSEKEHIMLVGHEPNLSLLLGRLLGLDGAPFLLKKGGLAHIEVAFSESGVQATLLWFMMPKHLRMLGKENIE